MKIAFVTNIFPPHTIGGYELGCRDIAAAFSEAGHDVHVLTSLPVGRLVKTRGESRLPVHRLFEPVFGFEADLSSALQDSLTWAHEKTEAFGGVHCANALALHRWLAAERPDVVWLFNTVGLGPVGIYEAALSVPARVVCLLMDDIDCYVAGTRRNLSWAPRFRMLKSRIDAMSCSRKMAERNRQLGPYRQCRVIYNGIRFPEVSAGPPVGEFTFCYFGQVEEPKGLLQIVRATRELLRDPQAGRFRIHLYGTGSRHFRERLAAEMADGGVEQHFVFHGFVEKVELLERVGSHDAALLLLKDAEPFGYAPLEAAACGLPSILTRAVGAAECLPDGFPLLVSNRDDAGEVAAHMRWCLGHRDALRPIGQRSLAEFRKSCDFDRVTFPSYVGAIEACPVTLRLSDLEAALASCRTADLYAQSRLGAERLRGADS